MHPALRKGERSTFYKNTPHFLQNPPFHFLPVGLMCVQAYDVAEVLGGCVGPLTCVVTHRHTAAAAAAAASSTLDVTADSVQLSLVQLPP